MSLLCLWIFNHVLTVCHPMFEELFWTLAIRGVWTPQARVLFDIHAVDTDTQSFCDHIPMAALSSAVCDNKHRLVKTVELLLPPSVCQLMICWDVTHVQYQVASRNVVIYTNEI